MTTNTMKTTIRIGRNDVGVDLAFIFQNYTMLHCSPKKNSSIYEKRVFNRRCFVGLPLQFFSKKVLGTGENCEAEKKYQGGRNEGPQEINAIH